MVQYRPNVAALVVDSEGRLLICERATCRGAWQFPQGGVDDGESVKQALYREVQEEIGLLPKHYKVVLQRSGYRYLYPPSVRMKKIRKHGSHGQEQTYFLCMLKANAPEVNVNQTPREFSNYRWINPADFKLKWLPTFKRDVYREVLRDFFEIAI